MARLPMLSRVRRARRHTLCAETPTRRRFPSGSIRWTSRPQGCSTIPTSNSTAMAWISPTRKQTSPSGTASPVCSERKIRAWPSRAIEAKAGKPGSNRCSHSWSYPKRRYQAAARTKSAILKTGTASSTQPERLTAAPGQIRGGEDPTRGYPSSGVDQSQPRTLSTRRLTTATAVPIRG